MIKRRSFLMGLAVAFTPFASVAHPRPPELATKYLPQYVEVPGYPPGMIIVDPGNRLLYFIEDAYVARRYGVGVGREGLAFQGTAVVGRKAEWPSWRPTDAMIERSPQKYAKHADGMPGGPDNPLGARALYLYENGRDTLYRIHGTNEPDSIGLAVSNGCIRMLNDHVMELYDRVPLGAPVLVL